MENISIILSVIVLIILFVIAVGIGLSCPKCKNLYTMRDTGNKIVGQDIEFETVTRDDIHRDKDGKEIGRTERKEQIKVKYTHYLNYHLCKSCGHKWTTKSTSRLEL